MTERSAAIACALLISVLPSAARANDYMLQSEAYARAEPGTAMLVLQGEGEQDRWVTAEAFVWGGLRDTEGAGDVLTVSVRLTEPDGLFSLRGGRFVQTLGAVRPVHVDGVSGWVRLPGELRLEAFGGMPVVPRFGERDWDWVVGTRLSRAIGEWGSVGASYLHQRDGGALADHEVGLDAGISVTRWLEAHGKASYDLVNPGFSEVRAAVQAREDAAYGEVFATHRSPGRLLPATSLFTVLGDVASEHVGLSGRYRLFPRLSLESTAAARVIGDFWGPSLRLATVLWLDSIGESAVTLEGRRESAPEDGNWTGVRIALRVALVEGVSGIGEAELVLPDHPDQRGRVWPWALLGVTWRITERWNLAGAVQGESSPQYRSRLDGIVRVTYRWETARPPG